MTETLGKLATDLGERSTYDAVSQCSRCGYCEQACPTYVATGEESKSPRGRNQIVRLMLEGKLDDKKAALEALSTCLLCGACSTACYAHVSVPDIVLEGRRRLREEPPRLVRFLTGLMVRRPRVLANLLRTANFLKRLGLSRLGRPVLRMVGLGGLAQADEHVEEAPLRFLNEVLDSMPPAPRPAWYYFTACGPNYLYPRVGLATVEVLTALKGPGRVLKTGCCGLLCYNYGELADARELARNVIKSAGSDETPIVADCSSCTAFLKSYPQLFLDDHEWKALASSFARRVVDAPQILGALADRLPPVGEGAVVYHDSCRACHGQGIKAEPRAVMKAAPGFKELPESDVCCGGAGAFSFVNPELSDEVLRRKIGRVAQTQARLVVTSSTSCLLQLAHGLRKYYPECRVMHISEFAALALGKEQHLGPTPGA